MTDYDRGFMDKCAEFGVDPYLLIKEAGPFGYLGDLAVRGWDKATKPITDFGERAGSWAGRQYARAENAVNSGITDAKQSINRGVSRVTGAVGNAVNAAGERVLDGFDWAGRRMINGYNAAGRAVDAAGSAMRAGMAAAKQRIGAGASYAGSAMEKGYRSVDNFMSPVTAPMKRVGDWVGRDYARYQANNQSQSYDSRIAALKQQKGYNRRIASYRQPTPSPATPQNGVARPSAPVSRPLPQQASTPVARKPGV